MISVHDSQQMCSMPVLYSIVYLTIYYASLGLVLKLYIPDSKYYKNLPYDLAHEFCMLEPILPQKRQKLKVEKTIPLRAWIISGSESG